MDAILPVFMAVLLGEMGGKAQMLAHRQGLVGSHATIAVALLVTSLISYGLAAAAGLFISNLISFDARSLLFGLALLFAGAPMVLKPKAFLDSPPDAGLPYLARNFATFQFGDSAQFLAFAMAARNGTPILATLGAVTGILAACLVPMMLGKSWIRGSTLTIVRLTGAAVLGGFGFWIIVKALRLV